MQDDKFSEEGTSRISQEDHKFYVGEMRNIWYNNHL